MQTESARQLMLQQQLRAGGVLQPHLLDVFARIPREDFVPASHRGVAFADAPIPLPAGQRMMTPLQEGLLLQALQIRPQDRIIEVGTGSAYLSACLAHLGEHLTSIEVHRELHETARQRLAEHGTRNCELLLADAWEFEPDTVDVVALTGSLPVADERFARWLNPGGRLFQIVGRGPGMQAWLVRRTGEGHWARQRLFETAVAPLEGAPAGARFAF